MESNNIYSLIILDRSGSMEDIRRQAVSAMNETIGTVKKSQEENPERNYFITLVVFSGEGVNGVRTVRDRIPASEIRPLLEDEYRPHGCTPLYDAMGTAVSNLSECVRKGDPVMVTVITDGMENSSRRYSGSDIKAMVDGKREAGWTFAYLGANQDAVEVARGLNIRNAMNWEATEDGTERMSEDLSRGVRHFCCAPPSCACDMEDIFDR